MAIGYFLQGDVGATDTVRVVRNGWEPAGQKRRLAWLAAVALLAVVVLGVVIARTVDHADASGCEQVAIIGDSLTVRDSTPFRDAIPGVIVNARNGRTTSEAVEAVRGIAESNQVDCWVFALGTNDVFFDTPPADSRAAIESLLEQTRWAERVWWVPPVLGESSGLDAAGFRALIPSTFELIDVTIQPDEFSDDGIHLDQAGDLARQAAILAAID